MYDTLDQLQQSGLLARHEAREVEPARQTLLDDDLPDPPAICLKDLAAFSFSCAAVAVALQLGALLRLIARIQRRKQRILAKGAPCDFEVARQRVHIFNRLRPFAYTTRDNSLFDSLALAEFLCRQEIAFTLVFGVMTQPFLGHCWVQTRGFLLNDYPSYIRSFTPILVV